MMKKVRGNVNVSRIHLYFTIFFSTIPFWKKKKVILVRGITGKFFWGAKSLFLIFFPAWNAFSPVENFGRPKTNFSKKKKKKKKVRSLFLFCHFSTFHFQFSIFPFTISLLFFSIFTPFPCFSCLVFPSESAEISQSEVSGSTLPPPVMLLILVQYIPGIRVY